MSVADNAVEIDAVAEEHTDDRGDSVPRRRCSRCRGFFECETGLDARVLRGWWLCEPCQAVLIGPKVSVETPVDDLRADDDAGQPC